MTITARTVELTALDPGELPTIFSTMNQKSREGEVFQAIGYLSWWNLTFPKVVLWFSRDADEITAHYYRADGTSGYTIGAILREDGKFSFHS